MGEKKVETPAKKANRIAFLSKTFLAIVTAFCILGGLSLGIFVQRCYLKGRFVPVGGNTFKSEVLFYPNEGTLVAVEKMLSGAERSINIVTDTIKSKRILDVLLAKSAEGIPVRVVFGKGASLGEGGAVFHLFNNGLREIYVDEIASSSPLILIDDKYVLVGSAGLSTTAAGQSSGAFVLVDSPDIAEKVHGHIKDRVQKARKVQN